MQDGLQVARISRPRHLKGPKVVDDRTRPTIRDALHSLDQGTRKPRADELVMALEVFASL